jgi:hypothetical protein
LEEPRWDQPLSAPIPQTDVSIRVRTPWPAGQVWWASPDGGHPELHPAAWGREGDDVRVTLPFLDTWAIAAFQRQSPGNNP